MSDASSQVPDYFDLDPSKHPVKVELQLPGLVLEKLYQLSQASGRSMDELVLEILDNSLREG